MSTNIKRSYTDTVRSTYLVQGNKLSVVNDDDHNLHNTTQKQNHFSLTTTNNTQYNSKIAH